MTITNRFSYIRLLFVVLMYSLSVGTQAVPAYPKPFKMKQKDGTVIEVKLIGDENYHYYSTTDGMVLVKENDAFFYADANEKGGLKSMGILAHNLELRNEDETALVSLNRERVLKHAQEEWRTRVNQRNEQRAQKTQARKVMQKTFGHPTTFKGKKKGIVILVNYADLTMKETSTRDAWDAQFNEPGYNKNNHYGSVRDYFLDQSYQQLEIDFDVVGPYTVSQGWRYYGKNKSADSNTDSHPCQLVSEACKLANADVNFKDYDWNGDGEVDQVFVVYAGYGAAAGYDDDAIWPHEWQLSYGAYGGDGTGALRLDGVKIDTYAVSCELNGKSGNTMDCIGVAVHEFSHCLGLPDFYDVDNKGTQCMDYWDVLDAGCYSGPNWRGEVPTGYTAYERNFAGWLAFEELSTPKKVTGMQNLGDSPTAYIYYNKGEKKEYFIMENRQAKAWFKYPGAHGLLVYHVDYDPNLWENDRPNNDPEHPRMVYIPADKSYSNNSTVAGMLSDFFPGTSNIRTLSNTSHVSCYGKMFNKNSDGTYNTNLNLSTITESAGKISFTFNGGEAAIKTQLGSLITQVSAMLEVPHVDVTEGVSSLLQEAITAAETTKTNATSGEELTNAIMELQKKAAEFLFSANPTDSLQPFDITFFFTNPEIKSNEGWIDEYANNGFTFSNNTGSYENLKFTLSQTTTVKLPKGDYTATCQAFQRPGAVGNNSQNTVNASFFARTKTIRIKHVKDESSDTKKTTSDATIDENAYVPNDAKGGNAYFKAGMYVNTIPFQNTLSRGNTIKIGIKCTIAKEKYWTCFANFKLYFHGDNEATAIKDIKTSENTPNSYDLSGRKVKSPSFRGIMIEKGKKKVK